LSGGRAALVTAFVSSFGLASCLGVFAGCSAPRVVEPAPRPNILFVLADDQRADTLAAFGGLWELGTPNLDGLSERGFSFTRASCAGGPHGAVCIPSRAMLMTGRAWFTLDLGTFDGRATLPERLRDAGYRTFMSGKWHNGRGTLVRAFPNAHAVLEGGMANHFEVPLVDVEAGEVVRPRVGDGHSSELFADAVVDFVRGYDESDPFFCYLAFTAPHDPRDAPLADRERWAARTPELPPNFLPQHPFDNSQLTTRDEMLAAWPRTPEVVARQLAEYFALIEHMDAQLGRVLAALEETGRLENTVVVFAADHGLAMGSHGLLGKQNVYEHSMRAPLIVAGPGVPRGSSAALTYLFDAHATMLRLAGVEPSEDVHALDLAPLWSGERSALRDRILTSQHHMRAITDGRYKLIRYPDVDVTQLFDLARDPHELADLAGRPEHASTLVRLRELLEDEQAALGDTQPWTSEVLRDPVVDLTGRERDPDRWQPDWIVETYF
jgi:arylsulfatase A-like enzyme